jgi:hypothetical protein
VLQFGIRAKVSALSLDGPVEWSLDRGCEEKLCLENRFQTLECSRCVKELLDYAYKLRRYSGVVKPQPVWSMATGREESTPEVLEP